MYLSRSIMPHDFVDLLLDARHGTLCQMHNFPHGGLYIGASKDLNAGTFFSGLIDDVRIYNVALTAEAIAALAQWATSERNKTARMLKGAWFKMLP